MDRHAKQYRCTRPDLYTAGPGVTDSTVREGHYIAADNVVQAARTMLAKYPEDTSIDVQGWTGVEDTTSVYRCTRNSMTRVDHVKAA
jgi:hypothetical protein